MLALYEIEKRLLALEDDVASGAGGEGISKNYADAHYKPIGWIPTASDVGALTKSDADKFYRSGTWIPTADEVGALTKVAADKLYAPIGSSGGSGGMTTEQGDARYVKLQGGGKIVSSYIDLDQDSGIRVVLTDDQGADRETADVISATDGMNGRIEIGSEKAGLTLNTRGKIEVYDDATQRHTSVTTDDMANSKKNYVRSGDGHWIDLQPLLDAITGGNGGTPPDLSGYLTKDEAARTYLSQNLANSTYETKTDADAKYLSKTDAAKDFLSKTDAANAYLTPSAADAKYDLNPTGLQDGFLYARATNGYHPLPELRKPVGVMHVDNSGHITGQISDSYAINILSTENTNYSYTMDFTPKDGDIFVLINDGEKSEHNLNWALPSGTSIKGYHSFNLTPGYELWTKYVESRKEFVIFRENLSQVRGSFEGTKSNPGVTKEGTVTRIVTKGSNADYNTQDGVLTLDMTPVDVTGHLTQTDTDKLYVGKTGPQEINGELAVKVTNGTVSVQNNGDKIALAMLHKDSITGTPAMIQTDREAVLYDARGDRLITTRSIPQPPESGPNTVGKYALNITGTAGQYPTWVKIPASGGTSTDLSNYYTKAEIDSGFLGNRDNQEVRDGSFRITNGGTHVRMVAAGDIGYIQAGTDEGVQHFKLSGYNGKDLDSLDFQMKAGVKPTVGGHALLTADDAYSKTEADGKFLGKKGTQTILDGTTVDDKASLTVGGDHNSVEITTYKHDHIGGDYNASGALHFKYKAYHGPFGVVDFLANSQGQLVYGKDLVSHLSGLGGIPSSAVILTRGIADGEYVKKADYDALVARVAALEAK